MNRRAEEHLSAPMTTGGSAPDATAKAPQGSGSSARSPLTDRWWSCTRKEKYRRATASRRARERGKNYYRCRYCTWYHVGGSAE